MKTFLKKNKALLLLPLALLPFVALIFYILGGGEKTGKETETEKADSNPTKKQAGVNYQLPQADRSIGIFDKMEAYQKKSSRTVTRDYKIMEETDSLYQTGQKMVHPEDSAINRGETQTGKINADVSGSLLGHIKHKEEQIRQELNGSNPDKNASGKMQNWSNLKSIRDEKTTGVRPVNLSLDEQALPGKQFTGIEELDKVFDENISLNRQNDSLNFYLKQAQQKLEELGIKKKDIFDLEKNHIVAFNKKSVSSSLIKAEIYETTTVLDGNRVKLRLLEDSRVNGKTIPKNIFIYGICRIKNERLHVEISHLPVGEDFLPVDLAVHDLDGLAGLYVPGNAARKVAKEVGSSTNTSSLFGVTTDPLTYAGVRAADQTAQSLFKMVRLKKVTLRENTLVYLINKKQQ